MSDHDSNTSQARTTASVERSRWPGWIWAVPIAALVIVAWLGIRHLSQGGERITVAFDRAAGMKPGSTSVEYRGLNVGKLESVELSKDGRHVVATLKMDSEVKRYLRAGTRFWLQGATPSLTNPASLKAILAGPTIIMRPGEGKPARHFIGLDYRPAIVQSQQRMIPYVMSFDGPVGSLKVGSAVTLRGFTVGEINAIGLRYDAATGALETPVIVLLAPSRFHINGVEPAEAKGRSMFDVVLRRLVRKGLRGRIVQNPPVIGNYQVALAFIPGGSPAALDTSGPLPAIPTAKGASLGSIVRRVNQLPIRTVAQHVLEITNRVQALVSSPDLQASLRHLDHTLAGLDTTVRYTGPQVTALVHSLRRTAKEMNRTALTANVVLGRSPSNQDRNVPAALYEVTLAARSVRALANYLDRHPEALLRGRGGE